MASIQDDIISWLKEQPDWIQKAAEELLSKESLNEDDIDELTEYLKSEEGQNIANYRKFVGLSKKVISDSKLHLVSIGDIKGIENLSPPNPLTFGNANLCVIYGHNGSGKSGYARIIKNACGKPRADKLRPNVFKEPPVEQKCTITYNINDKEHSIEWHPDNDPIEDLERVDIFDRDEAEFYLSKETEVSYNPPEIALFENLAQICDRVRKKLNEQQRHLISSLPEIPNEYAKTQIAEKYRNLKAEQKGEDLSELLNWTDQDQKSLNRLNERLKTSDPSKLAKAKKSKKKQFDKILSELKTTYKAINKESCNKIQELKNTANEKRKIATEGAKAQTESAKLAGIGTETWNALWAAAKDYSIKIAYPDREFPITEDGARCVLCHQKLEGDSPKRLEDFENYVQGKLETEAKEAEQNLKRMQDKLPEIPTKDRLRTACEAAGIDEEEWLPQLNEFYTEVQKICKFLRDNEKLEHIDGISVPVDMVKELNNLSEQLEEEIKNHQIDAKQFDKEKLINERTELEAKKWISSQKKAIKQELQRLKDYNQYESWKRKANSGPISQKAGEISKMLITEAYVQRFNNELKNLGADKLQVKLIKTRTERGRSKHQIKLSNVQIGNPEATSILSDGERRIIALAAFLADVTGRPELSPFIFDDPISSLDHEFEWDVAIRLTKLAKKRQVIVFTHRLSLYGILEEAEKKERVDGEKKNIEQRCIESFAESSGNPADEQAWVQNTRKANNTLINRLNEAKKYRDSGDINTYKIHAQSICTDFRKLLERTIEDDLLNKIVKRHRRSIMSDNILDELVKIKKEDADFLDSLMTKYSKFEHSQSLETPVDIPDEPEIRQDLEDLKTWRNNFKDRK
jgi:energy-coupling factor transporter ATP-binding protein EcfA2